ncbi:MAG: hypothetical protein BWK80_08525 [Desulfobacteraceae bacterium IS3]|nr:MAG: hypothetical protein BWK80_08525 [Desulfobacteraceae bacterium IS3]
MFETACKAVLHPGIFIFGNRLKTENFAQGDAPACPHSEFKRLKNLFFSLRSLRLCENFFVSRKDAEGAKRNSIENKIGNCYKKKFYGFI